MALYLDSVKLLIKFDDETLIDNITNNSFEVIGSDQLISLLDDGVGYVMKANQHLEMTSLNLSFTSAFSLGFWIQPVNVGQAAHPDTGELFPIKMPLLSFFTNETGSLIFDINEIMNTDGTNSLILDFKSRYTAKTEPYTPNVFHFIYIVYDGSIRHVDIYVDGKKQVLIQSGLAPDGMGSVLTDIFINKVLSPAFDTMSNQGVIDDIILFNDVKDAEERAINAVNQSVDFIADAILSSASESGQSFVYDDPATVRVTSVVDDLSFVYLARDDGKIMRGSLLFWEVRKVFSENNEEDLIRETILDGGVASSIDGGFLKIDSSLVQL